MVIRYRHEASELHDNVIFTKKNIIDFKPQHFSNARPKGGDTLQTTTVPVDY